MTKQNISLQIILSVVWMTVFQSFSDYEKLSWNIKECCLASLAFIILYAFAKLAQGFECIIQRHCNSAALLPKLHSDANLLLKNNFKGLIGTGFRFGELGSSHLPYPHQGHRASVSAELLYFSHSRCSQPGLLSAHSEPAG